MRRTLSLSTSIFALVCCGTILPQVAAAADENTGGIETVVVTAERRTEDLMKTSVTASVLSGEDLQNRNALNINDLQFIAPNVTINDFGQGVDFDIRGIGKGEHNTQTPIGVVIYQDGGSTPPGYLDGEPFYDIKGVEVYRGPQGTFVGQNATGGAVFINSNDPIIGGGYNGYAQAQYGNYNNTELQGALNIPVTDDFAVRIAGYGLYHSSWYSMTDTDPADACPHQKYQGCKPGYNVPDNTWGSARFSALWTPTDALTVSFKADGDYQNYGARPAIPYTELYPVGAAVPPYATNGYINITNPYHNTDLFHVTANSPERAMDRMMRAILKVDYVLPDGIKLQSVSEGISGNTAWMTDGDLTSYGNVGVFPFFSAGTFGTYLGCAPTYTEACWLASTKNDEFYDRVTENVVTQEFNIISPDNQPITWVAGIYGQENDYVWDKPYQFWGSYGSRLGSDTNPANFTPTAANFFQYESYTFEGHTSNLDIAAFGEIEAKLGGGVQASLGGRATETRSNNVGPYWNFGALASLAVPPQKSYNISYKAALDWAINDGNFVYAFVATGYTGGGLNVTLGSGAPNSFGPVTDTNYELGWKATDWFDGHVHSEIDAYYTTYNHFQVALEAPPPLLNTTDEYNLPAQTTNYGVEAELQAVFGQFSGTASLGLLRSQLGDVYLGDPRFNNVTFGSCDIAPSGSHTNPSCIHVKGHQMTYAPSATFNVTAQYIFNLGDGSTLTPRISYAHTSGQWASLFDNASLGDKLNPRDLVGGQLAWQVGTYIVALYGENLTNDQYISANDSGGLYAGAPRQYGIRLSKFF